jgi:hypothetical protein
MRARSLLSDGFPESLQPHGEGSLDRANIKLTFAHLEGNTTVEL